MADKKDLTVEECAQMGIEFSGVQMPNGEYRFRCMQGGAGRGYGYIMTVMPEGEQGWQNAHSHKGVQETYVVQKGWIVFASSENGQLKIEKLTTGNVVTTTVGVPHNVYMSSGSVIHTIKHGDTSAEKDWFADQELDAETKKLTEKDF